MCLIKEAYQEEYALQLVIQPADHSQLETVWTLFKGSEHTGAVTHG